MTSKNARMFILFQLVSRALTFAMNNCLTRAIPASFLGVVAVRLDLLATTIASLSRDGLRMALLRSGPKHLHAAWMAVPLTALVGAVVCGIASLMVPGEIVQMSGDGASAYRRAVWMYFAAAVLESATEAPSLACVHQQRLGDRVIAESVALIAKIVFVLCRVVLWGEPVDFARFIVAFAQGQLLHALILNVLYRSRRGESPPQLRLPSLPPSDTLSLVATLTTQQLFKFFLAQGDMLVVGAFSSLADQGVFAVTANYGSLVLRIVMQPMEEASMQFFSRQLAAWPIGRRPSPDNDDKDVKMAGDYFALNVKTMAHVALCFVAFAAFFTDPVVFVLLGRGWWRDTNVAAALGVYCWLVAVAGLSGFLEAFVHAVIDAQWIAWSRYALFASSLVYCGMAVRLILWRGSVGLIVASAVNFAVRAGINAHLAHQYWRMHCPGVWRAASVSRPVLCAFAVSFACNAALHHSCPLQWTRRIGVAVALFSVCCSVVYRTDRPFVTALTHHWAS